jgi:hypothetical protein
MSIGPRVLGHLDAQLRSTRALLGSVLEQGKAIRARDVEAVLACLAEIQGEMDRRGALEAERARILQHAGQALGLGAHEVTLDDLARLLEPTEAYAARGASAELRGLLAEVQREHVINRALMRQELAFLSHLTRMMGGEGDTGYQPTATVQAPRSTLRALDLEV